MMDELIALAKEYKKWSNEPWSYEDHASWCKFTKRYPALESDCNCAAFRDWQDKANEVAEQMSDIILSWQLAAEIWF